jgi:hypothetical protein
MKDFKKELLAMEPKMKLKAMESIGIDIDLDESQMIAAFDQMILSNSSSKNDFIELKGDILNSILQQDKVEKACPFESSNRKLLKKTLEFSSGSSESKL